MNGTPQLDRILAKFPRPQKAGTGWKVRCPTHEDREPSLVIYGRPDGSVWIECEAGCDKERVLQALGMEMKDLFPPRPEAGRGGRGRRPPAPPADLADDRPEGETVYDYLDEHGRLRFQVVRRPLPLGEGETKPRKKIYQRRPHPTDPLKWINDLNDIERIPYHLPNLIRADLTEWVYVVEGEKCADRLDALGLVATTNPQGAGKWRPEYNRWFEGRHVAILPDNDKPGRDHAAQVAKALATVAAAVKVVELPGLKRKGDDVVDWLDAGGTVEQLRRLVDEAPAYPALATNGNGHGAGDPEEAVILWEGSKWRVPSQNLIHKALLKRGKFIATTDDRVFYFDDQAKVLHEIPSLSLDVHLNRTYAINAKDAFYSYLVEDMKVEAYTNGDRAEVHQFSYYNRRSNVLYLDTGRGRMLRLDGKEVQEVNNGEDNTLFLPAPGADPWTYKPDAAQNQLREVLVRSLNFVPSEACPMTPDEQRILVGLWLLAMAFETIQPTKALALATGPAGSGKSNFFRRVGKLFYGQGFDVNQLSREGQKDFLTTVTTRRFVAFDNVDQYIPWLDDALAATSTGSRITMRDLYTTNRAVSYNARVFIGLTARTPRFRREDVAERLVIFNLDKLQEHRPEDELLEEIITRRDELMSDYAHMLNRVVAVTDVPKTDVSLRIADFAKVAMRVGVGLGIPDQTQGVLAKLKYSQQLYATEEHPLYYLLDSWLTTPVSSNGGLALAGSNESRPVEPSELFRELRAVAERDGMNWKCGSAVVMGRQLSALQDALSVHFHVKHMSTKNGRYWSFSRRDVREVARGS